jgi:hypothetical protein
MTPSYDANMSIIYSMLAILFSNFMHLLNALRLWHDACSFSVTGASRSFD